MTGCNVAGEMRGPVDRAHCCGHATACQGGGKEGVCVCISTNCPEWKCFRSNLWKRLRRAFSYKPAKSNLKGRLPHDTWCRCAWSTRNQRSRPSSRWRMPSLKNHSWYVVLVCAGVLMRMGPMHGAVTTTGPRVWCCVPYSQLWI